MVLKGPFASNSVLASRFLSDESVKDVPFVDSFSVTMMGHDSIAITLREKKPVGCIPYLDSFLYFDRNGVFIEGSHTRVENVPYFVNVPITEAVQYEKLAFKGQTILNAAVALSTIFQKNNQIPDYIEFDENSNISLSYGDIVVMLGKDEYLEDKMNRVIAVMPEVKGRKGILHLENVSDNSKTITFEFDTENVTAETWTGGYTQDGEFTGSGRYDEKGNYVGSAPETLAEDLKKAAEREANAYLDEDGDGYNDFTGEKMDTGEEEEKTSEESTAGEKTEGETSDSSSGENMESGEESLDLSIYDEDGDGINDFTGEPI